MILAMLPCWDAICLLPIFQNGHHENLNSISEVIIDYHKSHSFGFYTYVCWVNISKETSHKKYLEKSKRPTSTFHCQYHFQSSEERYHL